MRSKKVELQIYTKGYKYLRLEKWEITHGSYNQYSLWDQDIEAEDIPLLSEIGNHEWIRENEIA